MSANGEARYDQLTALDVRMALTRNVKQYKHVTYSGVTDEIRTSLPRWPRSAST